jgi:hypothetical protein
MVAGAAARATRSGPATRDTGAAAVGVPHGSGRGGGFGECGGAPPRYRRGSVISLNPISASAVMASQFCAPLGYTR